VTDSSDKTSRGPLRSLYDWLTGATPPPSTPSDTPPGDNTSQATGQATRASVPARLGHYTITRKLGQGGMGVVYEARDERLERTVALKTLPALSGDESARKRLWREARAAASVNHPNICQIYEIGEDTAGLFIAMELLEGEPLSDQLQRGPLKVADAVGVGLEILSALSALHARGIVHRDLKPSNVFRTPHGVKLLDFGLARPEVDSAMSEATDITRTGMIMGTPRYMAPESVRGEPIDARSDLFATGAILFEMLAGRPAFDGRSIADVIHATVYEQPPALSGSSTVAAVDRVIRQALAKRPSERLPSADVMAEELRWAGGLDAESSTAQAHALTRLVVLPFRVLKPDPETDFLAFSLPDAITTSLSGTGSLVVRSSAVAARFAADAPDLKALATEANVDRVVMGTLLRSGDQLRAVAQLVEAPGGTVVTSHTVQAPLGDLFGMQDDIARRVVDALSLPLTGVAPYTPDTPHNARAYELYLRANELARTYEGVVQARDLYEQCLDLDPAFAPAWAHLGRCHRVIAKFIDGSSDEARAKTALDRALALNPRLSVAHKYYAQLEADMGQSTSAMVRLLQQATQHGNDPELFAGLVHACRYCGLFDQGIDAYAEAKRLDPNAPATIEQTILMTADVDRLLALGPRSYDPGGGDQGIKVIGLGLAGRRDEAREVLLTMTQMARIPLFHTWMAYLQAWLDGRVHDMLAAQSSLSQLKIMSDPEALFQIGVLFCDVGEYETGLDYVQRAIARGYYVAQTLERRTQFDAVRDRPAFKDILAAAQEGRNRSLAAFRDAGGERLLGRR
jgi:serine/threonine protein kinase/tetratricopeptide (TPR) repeat protein